MRAKLLTLVMFFCVLGNVYAQERSQMSQQKKNHGVGEGPSYGKQEHELPAAYSAPARIDCTGGWDVSIAASFIYWHISQQQMEIGNFRTGDSPPTQGMITQRFKYKPGFKVALGTNCRHDNWTARVEYTRIHGTTSIQTAPPQNPPGSLFTKRGWAPAIDGSALNTLSSKWECDLDLLDGELARWYYSGHMLTFRPFCGIRAAWLDQKMNMEFSQINSPNEFIPIRFKTDSWLLGPRAGVDGNWILGWGFRLTGNAAFSLLFQKVKYSATLFQSPDTVNQFQRHTLRQVTPNTEIGTGLGWGSYFMNNSWHFDLYAAYEFHYFWNQNILRYVNMSIINGGDTPVKAGDLMYHGLTLTARFDF